MPHCCAICGLEDGRLHDQMPHVYVEASVMTIEVIREPDGRYACVYEREGEQGCCGYADTVVGALMNLCSVLAEVDGDSVKES